MIDLRSDTVTRPTPAMRAVMAAAEVGDDVYAEDPTIRALEERVAKLLGHEAALFMPSGVMANQTAINILTRPGDEVVVEAGGHVLQYETGAAPVLSGVQLRPVQGVRGLLTPELIEPVLRGPDYHLPVSRLICLENTHNKAGGTIIPLNAMKRMHEFARTRGIAVHLDGARLWNACVALGCAPSEFGALADTVSVCFSKGLGAPVGSALASSKETIVRARKVRKMLGGGMRQAGILAAAALYALDHHVDRLAEDHAKAKSFASIVGALPGFRIDPETVQTNIVAIDMTGSGIDATTVAAKMREKGILLSVMDAMTVRAVMHLDVSAEDVERAAKAVKETFGR